MTTQEELDLTDESFIAPFIKDGRGKDDEILSKWTNRDMRKYDSLKKGLLYLISLTRQDDYKNFSEFLKDFRKHLKDEDADYYIYKKIKELERK